MVRRLAAFFMAFFLCLSMAVPSFASVATPSNATPSNAEMFQAPALMAAVEDISTYSSFASVTNTVDLDYVKLQLPVFYDNGSLVYHSFPIASDGSFSVSSIEGANYFTSCTLLIYPGALPALGKYKMEIDFASNISLPFLGYFYLDSERLNKNANIEKLGYEVYPQYNDGDVYYCTNIDIDTNVRLLRLAMYLESPYKSLPINGDVKISFTRLDSSASTDVSTAGSYSAEDVQGELADSSSQTAQNTSVIASATQSMAEHYTDMLSQVTYISDQIHAFWEQWSSFQWAQTFPHISAQVDRIVDALGNMDGLGATVSNFAQQIMQNDDKNTDQILNSYDDSEIESSNQVLADSIKDQQEQEDQIMVQISEPLESFEFENPITQYLSTFQLFGDFLQDLFTSSGAFADVINLSFIMGIALMVAGLYRFKGGN